MRTDAVYQDRECRTVPQVTPPTWRCGVSAQNAGSGGRAQSPLARRQPPLPRVGPALDRHRLHRSMARSVAPRCAHRFAGGCPFSPAADRGGLKLRAGGAAAIDVPAGSGMAAVRLATQDTSGGRREQPEQQTDQERRCPSGDVQPIELYAFKQPQVPQPPQRG
jgi:hypothetical protein